MKGPICELLLAAWLASVGLAQEVGDELAQKVAALRAATGDEAIAAWTEIRDFVRTATHLPAAARTDALAAGLELESLVMHIVVLRALVHAPDGPRAAHHLLAACEAQDLREQKFASERRPVFDVEEARIFGFQPIGDGGRCLDDLMGLEVRTRRKELLAACRAHRHPESAQGLTLLVRRLASDPECEPLFDALLEHPPADSIEGVMAVIEAGNVRLRELREDVESGKKWEHRDKPLGRSNSEWKRSEEETKRRMIALRQRRVDAFEHSLDEKAARLGRYAADWRLPAPPRQGMPVKPWQYWCETVRKLLVKPPGEKG